MARIISEILISNTDYINPGRSNIAALLWDQRTGVYDGETIISEAKCTGYHAWWTILGGNNAFRLTLIEP